MPFSDLFGGGGGTTIIAGSGSPGYFGANYFGGGGSGIGDDVDGVIYESNGSIEARVGSTATVNIECNRVVTSLTLAFTVETIQKTDVAIVADADITKIGTSALVALTSAMTASERTLRWSLVNTTDGDAVDGGLMFVTYDAQGD